MLEDGDFGLLYTYVYNMYCIHMYTIANKKPVNPCEDRTLTFFNSFPTENGHFPPNVFVREFVRQNRPLLLLPLHFKIELYHPNPS